MSRENPAAGTAAGLRRNLTTGNGPPSHLRQRQVLTVGAMYVGYAMFMTLRMIPAVAGPAMRNDPSLGIDLEVWGRILALGTCGAILGKFIGGYAADLFGGRRTFAAGLVVCSIFVGLFAVSSHVWLFQLTFFFALMAKSLGWPSMTKIVGNWFSSHAYGRVWGIISTSSRVGTLTATLGLGALLTMISWRFVLLIPAVAGLLVAAGFFWLLKERPEQLPTEPDEKTGCDEKPPHPLDGTTVPQALLAFAGSLQFWLITGSLMALTIMWDFLLMVPLYLEDTLFLPEDKASMTASAFPFGSLISVLAGGYLFDKLNRRTTAWVMGGLLLTAAGCILTFLMMPQMGLTANQAISLSLALLFVFGLCVSPCYYIPMSVFSIEFGGPHSGILVSLLDATAFGVNAIFQYFGGGIAQKSWQLYLVVLLSVVVFSCVTTFFFMLRESKRQANGGQLPAGDES
jgi:sugar phosphate permease